MVDWVLVVQLNHPPVPVPLPIHHVVGPDDGSVFSSGTVLGEGRASLSSTGPVLRPLLNTPGVGGELHAKHRCFTRALCSSDEGSSAAISGDDRLSGVGDEDDVADVLSEEESEGGERQPSARD